MTDPEPEFWTGGTREKSAKTPLREGRMGDGCNATLSVTIG